MSRTCPECRNTYEDEVLHCPEDGLNLSAVAAQDELIGRSIGSYRVEKLLGKGGMGSVYMGVHPGIGSRVAIKFLHPQFSHDERIVERFFNEARAVNVIGHDNILKILDLNITDDHRHYFVMEFLHGKPLQNLIKQGKWVPLDIAGPILMQCCRALEAAHRKGIVHRDLKPDNVYLITLNNKQNFVKVVDFGIARVTDDAGISTGKTQTGMVMGTPAYMSPEQGSGATAKIDARSDIYSLGVMMFQLATGKLPFPGTNFGEVLIGHLQQKPPQPRSLNPEIPESYERVILKCLEKQQDDRFQSMAELFDAITDCLDELGISHELPHADDGYTDPDLPPLDARPGSNPGVRTPSHPGRSTGPGARRSAPNLSQRSGPNLGQRRSIPPQSRSVPPQATEFMPEPKKSRLGLFAGLGLGVALLVGGLGFVIVRQQQASIKALEDLRRTTQAAAKPPRPEAPAKVFLSVVSDPADAEIAASWKGGEQRGTAPIAVNVPKDSKVHFAVTKDGFLPYEMEVVADQNQTVTARLRPEPKVASIVPEPEREKPKKKSEKRSRKKGVDAAPASADDVIDIGDALK